jgi:hypothetical protein
MVRRDEERCESEGGEELHLSETNQKLQNAERIEVLAVDMPCKSGQIELLRSIAVWFDPGKATNLARSTGHRNSGYCVHAVDAVLREGHEDIRTVEQNHGPHVGLDAFRRMR